MKRHVMALGLILSCQGALLGCATCVSLAEKNPGMPKNEVFIQLKKGDGQTQTRRSRGSKKKVRKKCKAQSMAPKAE